VRIDSDFTVAAPIDTVWKYLLDVERVAPCMPGAELTDVVDARTWKGKTNVKLGPVSLSFAGTVVMEERDDSAHRVRLNAQGREQRGKGAASAIVVSHLEAVEGGTRVAMATDLTITGAVAQYGRGMIADISQRMTREFAQCLEASIVASQGPAPPEVAGGPKEPEGASGAGSEQSFRPSKPVQGFRLGVWALWRAVVRFVGRFFRRRSG
jgi:uncharacterized protein